MRSPETGGNEWVSVSDLMSGLMLVFLALTIFYMRKVQDTVQDLTKQKEEVELVSSQYLDVREDLARDLEESLGTELVEWNATFDRARLAIVFVNDGRSYFAPGSATPSSLFKDRLDQFFPKYVKVLERHKANITEVRIEGHTDPHWDGPDPYIGNMKLSQGRARNVLAYVLPMPSVQGNWGWLEPVLTANGLSFSQALPDDAASRRVEFRILTDAAASLDDIRLILEDE